MSIDIEVILNEISEYDYYKEFRFLPNRRFRFDYMFPLQSPIIKGVAIEFEGGAWSGGRHTRPQGFIKDCQKYNLAVLSGYVVLRFTSESLKDPDKVKNEIELTLKMFDVA